MEIYIAKEKKPHGPYCIEDLVQMFNIGIVKKYDLYWHEGMPDWAPLAALGICKPIERIKPIFNAPSPPKKGTFVKDMIGALGLFLLLSIVISFLILIIWAMSQGGSSSSASSGKHSRIIVIPKKTR
jgi:hypothetical protein